MVVNRRIRTRGGTVTVEAHAEVLLMPGGQVHNWHKRLIGKIRAETIKAAPTNKRPRWDHYGKPLKSTIFSAKPAYWGNGRDKQRIYGAVGSTAPHAYYVNEGTGVFAGRGPYPAKILPPWTRGGSSLYEHTWRPAGPGGRRVPPVMIQGQKPQFFMQHGLTTAMTWARLRAFQVAADPRLSNVMGAESTGLDGFSGNTPVTGSFITQLEQWRAWRDEAWDAGMLVGNHQRMDPNERKRNAKHNSKKSKEYRSDMARKGREHISKEEFIRRTKEAADRRHRKELAKAKDKAERKRRGERAARAAAIEAERKFQLGRLKLQATDLARRYANADYTGVRLQALFNKDHTAQTGWRVVYTSPSGESGKTSFKISLKDVKRRYPKR